MQLNEEKFDQLCLDIIKAVDYDLYKEVKEEFDELGQPQEMLEVQIALEHYGIYRYVNYN